MAFADYTDLLISVSEYTGRDDVSHLFGRFAALAEAKLNRQLRIADMETSAQLTTDAAGDAALPAAYLEMREVKDSAGRVLKQASLPGMTRQFANRAGTPCNFTISGTTFKVRPTKAATFDIVYFQKIPSLETNGTNWLLTRAPDIYLYALAAEVGAWEGNAESVAAARSLLDPAIAGLSVDDSRAKWSMGSLKLGGVTP